MALMTRAKGDIAHHRDDLREPLHARAGARPARRAHPARRRDGDRRGRRAAARRAGDGDGSARLGVAGDRRASRPRARRSSIASITSTAASSGWRRSSAPAGPTSPGSWADPMTAAADRLKLIALDREGLDVISAHAQNTCVKRADMVWLPKQRRFVVAGMRYDWVRAQAGPAERVSSVLRFDRVLKVSHLGLGDADEEATLNLLARHVPEDRSARRHDHARLRRRRACAPRRRMRGGRASRHGASRAGRRAAPATRCRIPADGLTERDRRGFMAVELDRRSPDFEARFAALLGAKRESAADVDAAVAAIIDDVRARGDAALAEYSLRLRPGRHRRARACEIGAAEIDAAVAACDAEALEGARTRARARDRLSRAPEAGGRPLHRRARGRTRLALAADRRGRPLCARRRGELSLLGADERRAGEGRGLPARSRWSCRRRTATSIRWCWRRRASPASTRSTASAARRRSRRSPTAPRPSRPSPRSSGPGNAYVAAAKRRVFGVVGIDMIAGPVRGGRSSPTAAPIRASSPPTCSPRPSTTRRRSRS